MKPNSSKKKDSVDELVKKLNSKGVINADNLAKTLRNNKDPNIKVKTF